MAVEHKTAAACWLFIGQFRPLKLTVRQAEAVHEAANEVMAELDAAGLLYIRRPLKGLRNVRSVNGCDFVIFAVDPGLMAQLVSAFGC